MKLAILSDIHGNTRALASVLDDIRYWQPDFVIMNGDLVSRGPYSLDCLNLLRDEFPDASCLMGNHEEYVLDCVDHPSTPGSHEHELNAFARWTASQLGDEVDGIRAWPEFFESGTGTAPGSFHVTHGSLLGKRQGILANADAEDLKNKVKSSSELFVGSHTHRPLVLEHGQTLVVNTGSVGQPLDNDVRASYARCWNSGSGWQAEIRRVAYDHDRALADFHDSGFMEECGPLAYLIYQELKLSRMLVGPWMRQYLPRLRSGEVNMESAVAEYLQVLAIAV